MTLVTSSQYLKLFYSRQLSTVFPLPDPTWHHHLMRLLTPQRTISPLWYSPPHNWDPPPKKKKIHVYHIQVTVCVETLHSGHPTSLLVIRKSVRASSNSNTDTFEEVKRSNPAADLTSSSSESSSSSSSSSFFFSVPRLFSQTSSLAVYWWRHLAWRYWWSWLSVPGQLLELQSFLLVTSAVSVLSCKRRQHDCRTCCGLCRPVLLQNMLWGLWASLSAKRALGFVGQSHCRTCSGVCRLVSLQNVL